MNADEHEITPGVLTSAVRDLAMVGLDRVTGWMDQSALQAWTDAGHSLDTVPQLTAHALSQQMTGNRSADAGTLATILDVRNDDEWSKGHLAGATHIPLGHLGEEVGLSVDTPIVVQCQAGARSSIAASVLKRAGYRNVTNLTGGYNAWVEAAQPTVKG